MASHIFNRQLSSTEQWYDPAMPAVLRRIFKDISIISNAELTRTINFITRNI
jgi:hypothetical protein